MHTSEAPCYLHPPPWIPPAPLLQPFPFPRQQRAADSRQSQAVENTNVRGMEMILKCISIIVSRNKKLFSGTIKIIDEQCTIDKGNYILDQEKTTPTHKIQV